jgi:sulfhydrogenase subunit beta (sulfur reductase)
MKELSLEKENVKALCVSASEHWETYVPLESIGGDTHFIKLAGKDREQLIDKLNLDYESLVVPPKFILFPQLESLFKFEGEKIIETIQPATKKLLFGLRACDVKALKFMDNFFKRNFEDIYYLNRSMDKLLVIVGCKSPLENCFCTSAKTGPFLEDGFDLQLVDIGDKYAVEIGSEKGEEFVDAYRQFFAEASKDDLERSKTAKCDAERAVSLKLDFEKAIKRFCEDKVPEQIYEAIAQRCIYCGGCLYVCPTCTCFNVFDERKENSGGRYRNWDACVFEGYTREASGHNPRHQKWIRTSRRYEHKLKYDYLTTGTSGCVGCGRCLSSCPVNIGISQVIKEVTKI